MRDDEIERMASEVNAEIDAEAKRILEAIDRGLASGSDAVAPSPPPAPLPPAGWYEAPGDPSQQRYWDGQMWTEHFAALVPSAGTHVEKSPGKLGNKDWWFGRTPEQLEAKAKRQAKLEELKARPVTRAPKRPPKQQVPSLAEMVANLSLEPPRHPLDEQIEVVGETYHVKGIKNVFRELGMPITTHGSTLESLECILVPEPWNPHDPNAVAVVVGTHQVGHVPAELAAEYAEPLGALAGAGFLATGEGRIWAKDEGGGMVRARVTILVATSDVY